MSSGSSCFFQLFSRFCLLLDPGGRPRGLGGKAGSDGEEFEDNGWYIVGLMFMRVVVPAHPSWPRQTAVKLLCTKYSCPGRFVSSSSFLACNSRLHSTICRHHPPQRAVLSQICCFGERKVVLFQILLDGAEPRDAGTT